MRVWAAWQRRTATRSGLPFSGYGSAAGESAGLYCGITGTEVGGRALVVPLGITAT